METSQFTIGNAVTIGVVVFGAGGIVATLKAGLKNNSARIDATSVRMEAGLKDVRDKQVQDSAHQTARMEAGLNGVKEKQSADSAHLAQEMSELRKEFVRKDVDGERDKASALQIAALKEQSDRTAAQSDRTAARMEALESAFRGWKR